jgi:phosphate/sulfate permease
MDASLALWVLIGLIAIALLFDFLNGMHDAANSIATIVSTRVLRPQYAVMWAAFFNFIAFLFFGLHVADTVGRGIISAEVVDARVIFGALIGAISWNVITWYYGIPSSSSHALIGGLIGSGIAKAGVSSIVWGGVIKTASAIVLSPLTGFFLALLLVLVVTWLFVRRQHIPQFSVRVGFALFARARRQRRPKDHGHHRGSALLAGISRGRIPRAVLGGDHLPGGDGVRHAVRRLADREDDGLEDHAAHADARVLRRDRRLDGAVRRDLDGHPGLDHSHHHRLYHRCRRRQARVGGALERGRQHRLRLDHHAAGVRRHRGRVLPAGRTARIGTLLVR